MTKKTTSIIILGCVVAGLLLYWLWHSPHISKTSLTEIKHQTAELQERTNEIEQEGKQREKAIKNKTLNDIAGHDADDLTRDLNSLLSEWRRNKNP